MKKPAVFLVLVLLGLAGCSQQTVVMGSTAMSPTLKKGQRLKIDTQAYTTQVPARWDVVAVDPDGIPGVVKGRPLILRVVGLPGETVSFQDNQLHVNGKQVAIPESLPVLKAVAPYPGWPSKTAMHVPYPFQVSAGRFFVIGDNTTNSYDSRIWGALPQERILGRVCD